MDSNESTLAHSPTPSPSPPDLAALRILSDHLATVFSAASPFSDASISVSDGREVPVHRCVLAARSSFFKSAFREREASGRSDWKMEMRDLGRDFEVGFEALVRVLGYLYSGRERREVGEEGVCVCVDEECCHVACRPAVGIMVEVLYAAFVFQIPELVALYQRHLLDILDKILPDDLLVIILVANICGKSCETLLTLSIKNIIQSDVDIITLEKTLPQNIVKKITDSRNKFGLHDPKIINFPNKHIKRIHSALDSDDVELVRMLLKEEYTNLDDAYALHYAVAYCDPKTTMDLLDLAIADVSRRNSRGYTVLHVAAMRKDPKIIVSLLTKGARPTDLTLDGRKAIQITKRLTRAVDYHKLTEEGKESPKDRLCIEILEQAERRDPLLGEASESLAEAGDDLRMRLLYLENRVGLAKLLFPMEAKVAMDIAQVDGTYEFTFASININKMAGVQQKTMDLNDAPFKIKEEHLSRLRALSRTVELGKHFFPRCSQALNKIMDNNDYSELAYLDNEHPDNRDIKEKRYMELQEVLSKAFYEDKEEFDKSNNISSSSSSTSVEVAKPNGELTFIKQINSFLQ